jgi:putative heme iron utilization protein
VLFFRCHLTVKIRHAIAHILARLRQRHPVGILVQRVRGHHLKRVGKVPLGTHRKGHLNLRWNLRVNGHKLRPGRYQITLRALDKHKRVLGLSTPVKIRVKR